MPYKRIGTTIYTKKAGKWKKKQTTGSVAKAEAALRLLRGLEKGSIKPSEVGKGKFAKSKKKTKKKGKKKKGSSNPRGAGKGFVPFDRREPRTGKVRKEGGGMRNLIRQKVKSL